MPDPKQSTRVGRRNSPGEETDTVYTHDRPSTIPFYDHWNCKTSECADMRVDQKLTCYFRAQAVSPHGMDALGRIRKRGHTATGTLRLLKLRLRKTKPEMCKPNIDLAGVQ